MNKKNVSSSVSEILEAPLISIEKILLTPGIPQPLKLEQEQQKVYAERNFRFNSLVFVAFSKTHDGETNIDLLRPIGMVCQIDRVLQMPGAPSLVFCRPLYRGKLLEIKTERDFPFAKVEPIKNIAAPKRLSENSRLTLEHIESLFNSTIQYMGEPEKEMAEKMIAEHSDNLVSKLYAYITVSPISIDEKYNVLTCLTFAGLLNKVAEILDIGLQQIELQAKIHQRTHQEISRQQKENFLRIHLHQIQEELGETELNDIDELINRSQEKIWPDKAELHFVKEIGKLRRLNINNPEFSVQFDYLDTFLDLPWCDYSKSEISIDKVSEVLERDHFGLEKVKERILEYIAVLKLRNDLKAPILCLYGPPGVGKTSIGKSIAEAMGREYVRIALGGMHDEAEIRGHRRTYIGAMPGRFLHSLSKCEHGNPLILLDEIDKVGKDFKGDPSSALLEALDPEQNNTFHDNFIDFPYDLSKVLFIATANDLSTIPAPLRDRMEVIEMSGYIPAEKLQIALRHLVAKASTDNGFPKDEIKFTSEAIEAIIKYYTREAGVRQLEKKISKILRKIALKKAKGEEYPEVITEDLVYDLLGKKEVRPEIYEDNSFPGVAVGLAWTPVGGDILYIETSLSPGKGEKITLTGNLGDVMKESAVIGLQYLKANAAKFSIDQELFSKFDVHIHVPEGAVPKDGPSAGITLVSSMFSAFTDKKLRSHTAMTGEITLRGKILPVGGIKEKIIAARQGGVKRIILSEENKSDIEEIPEDYVEGLEFIYVKSIPEVIAAAFD